MLQDLILGLWSLVRNFDLYSFIIIVTYRSIPGDVSVTIAGSSCTVSTATDTELECVTGPHAGSVVADVKVEVSGNGIAQEVSILFGPPHGKINNMHRRKQRRSNCEADQHLCFRYMDSKIPLLSKSKISSL